MKRIKLFTALLLAAAMVLPMAGCGKGKPKDGGEASPASCAAAGEYEVYSMTTAGTNLTRSHQPAHGMAEYYDCTGVYEANNRNQCEILARITYDEDAGELKPFVGAAFDGANQYNFKITSATEYQDDSYRYFKIGGRFMDQPLAEGSLVEYEAEYDRLWVIGIADDGEGNVLKMLGCLRRPGAKWDYENDYPYIDKDGVEFYKGKSLEEIAKLFKVDLNAQ